MKLNFKINVTTIIVAFLAILFLVNWRGAEGDSQRWEDNYNISDSTFKSYKSETDGTIINYQKSIRLTENELEDALESDSINAELAEHYRKLSEVVTIKTVFVHDSIPFEVPIYIDRDTTVSFADKCLEFDVRLTTGKMTPFNFRIENEQRLVIGNRKAGLFKSTQSMDIHNTNKCFTVTGITHQTVVEKKKWWENPLITGGAGIGLGYVVGKALNK